MKTFPEIQDLSLSEKLRLMEALWEDLSDHAENIPISERHRKILEQRHHAVEEGNEEILEWDEVKRSLSSGGT